MKYTFKKDLILYIYSRRFYNINISINKIKYSYKITREVF